MASMSELRNKLVDITITVEDLQINMTVRKNFMTPSLQLELIEAAGDPKKQTTQALVQFCEFVALWDIVDDDGAMVPLDPNTLDSEIPINVLWEIMSSSVEAIRAMGK